MLEVPEVEGSRAQRLAGRSAGVGSLVLAPRRWPRVGAWLMLAFGGAAPAAARPPLPGSGPPAASCPTGGLELLGAQWLVVAGDCTVEGDILLRGSSVLIVTDSTFLVRGNIAGFDQATLHVQRSDFTVDNRFNGEWTIEMSGGSVLSFSETVLRTSLGTGRSYFMTYHGQDSSELHVNGSSVATANSWLLGRFTDQAFLRTADSTEFPSEVFPLDQSTVRVESGSRTSVWLSFHAGSGGLLVLPDQTAGPYSFSFGRDTPNMVGIDFDVRITDSRVRLGVISEPLSHVGIIGRGRGAPGWGELTIGYNMPGVRAPEVVAGLRPGYQMYTRLTHQSRTLILYNVDIDPVGWSVWVSGSSAPVTVRDSIVNEVAAFPGGKVQVEGSILQWAVLGSTGQGSTLSVRNSHVYSQVIHSQGDGRIDLVDSVVHGSPFEALDDSRIQVTGGLLLESGTAEPCDTTSGLTTSGVPLCSPFLAPGQLPTVFTDGNGQVTMDGPAPPAITDIHLVGWTEPVPVSPGGVFTYHVQAGNAGPDAATGVRVLLRTPPQPVAESFSPGCAAVGRNVLCTVGSLPVFGGSNWLSVNYRLTRPETPLVGHLLAFGLQTDPEPANHYLKLTNAIVP